MADNSPNLDMLDPLADARDEALAILDRLTERQVTVLEFAAQMYTNDEIAFEIGKHRRTVEEHLVAARTKLNAKNRTDAIRKYIVLLTIVGRPTCDFIRVELTGEDIEKLLLDLSFERATDLLSSPEFEEFMAAFRSTGPKALDAGFGPWWRPLAGMALAALMIALLLGSIWLGPALDSVFAD